MDDLLGKLNVLFRARLRSLAQIERGLRSVSPPSLGGDIDREIIQLRESLSAAFEHEDQLRAQLRNMQAEVDQYDRLADEAIKQGQTDTARQSVEAMQRTQRRMTMLESDLQEHQRAAQDLLQRVNLLEAVVADGRSQEKQSVEEKPTPDIVAAKPSFRDILEETKDTVAQLATTLESREADLPPEPNERSVEDDIERRIARLSRR